MTEPLAFGSVHVYLGEKSGKYPDGNQVIIHGADMRVAFDTPLCANHIGQAFDGVDLVILGHVHEDHMAGLHRVPHACVQVYEADLAAAQSWEGLAAHYGYPPAVLAQLRPLIERNAHYRPRPDAGAYADGEQWALGGGVRIRAHHLPGHTAGHCALVVENEGVAFIGDIDLTGFGPYYGDATSDLDAFEQSLVRVRELDARVWVTSHHRAVLTERAAFEQALDAFAARIGERDDRLIAYLRERPHTLAELAARGILYPLGVDLPWAACAESRSIAMHLARLQACGQVQTDGSGVWALAV